MSVGLVQNKELHLSNIQRILEEKFKSYHYERKSAFCHVTQGVICGQVAGDGGKETGT